MEHHSSKSGAELCCGTLLLVFALGASLIGCDQPGPKCSVARGDFAASYTLVEGTGACAELQGETLSVQSYSAPVSETNSRPDPNKTSIAIQPGSINDLLASARSETNPDDQPYAMGAFDSAEPHPDSFCVAPELSVARVRLEALPEEAEMCTTLPAQSAVDIKYEWSNVKVYASASAYGTQLSADLVYTKDGCTAKYRVTAVYPVVSCGVPLDPPAETPAEEPPLDMDGGVGEADAACPPEEPTEDPGELVPDDSLCEAVPPPESGSIVGSGINPDLAVGCHPDLLLCVLKKEPPAWRE
jgi:hypothetical protein